MAEEAKQPQGNKIQVSSTKKPLYFYINLAKRFLRTEEEVELSALGNAISTVVTIAEILKEGGLITVSKINTSTVDMTDPARYRPVQKAKISILVRKTPAFFELVDKEKAEYDAKKAEKEKEKGEKPAEVKA
eukprot:tig00000383_g24668.t1